MLRHILSFAAALLVTIAIITAAAAAQEDNDAATGRQMIHRAQQAFGGADKLAAIRDFTQTIDVAMETLPGGVKVKQSNRYLAPGIYRQDQDMPFGKISSYVDGESGWRSTPRGSLIMSPPVLKMALDELFRNLFVVMAADRDPSVNVKAVGPSTVEISKADGFTVKLEFDASTGLPLRKVYVASDPHGPPHRDRGNLRGLARSRGFESSVQNDDPPGG
jgi:hypothetical protein